MLADVLKIAANGTKKTRILFEARMAYEQLETYLDAAVKLGF
jgi:predicted transcriptional regulator